MTTLELDGIIGRQGDFAGSGRWFLAYAARTCAQLNYGTDLEPDDEKIIAWARTVQYVAERPGHFVQVSDADIEAVREVLDYAAYYWTVCDYANQDGSDEEKLAGWLAREYGNCLHLLEG